MSEDISREVVQPPALHSAIAAQVTQKSELVEAAKSAIAENDVVILGMRQNPVPKAARKLLDANNIPYMYLEWGSYMSMWRERLDLKMWTGWKTFPMIFIRGVFIGGFDDLKALHASGELAEMLAKESV